MTILTSPPRPPRTWPTPSTGSSGSSSIRSVRGDRSASPTDGTISRSSRRWGTPGSSWRRGTARGPGNARDRNAATADRRRQDRRGTSPTSRPAGALPLRPEGLTGIPRRRGPRRASSDRRASSSGPRGHTPATPSSWKGPGPTPGRIHRPARRSDLRAGRPDRRPATDAPDRQSSRAALQSVDEDQFTTLRQQAASTLSPGVAIVPPDTLKSGSSLRSQLAPLHWCNETGSAGGVVEDTLLGKRLLVGESDELVSAHPLAVLVALRLRAEAARFLESVAVRMAEQGYPAVFVAIRKAASRSSRPHLERVDCVEAAARVYGYQVPPNADWWIDTAEI